MRCEKAGREGTWAGVPGCLGSRCKEPQLHKGQAGSHPPPTLQQRDFGSGDVCLGSGESCGGAEGVGVGVEERDFGDQRDDITARPLESFVRCNGGREPLRGRGVSLLGDHGAADVPWSVCGRGACRLPWKRNECDGSRGWSGRRGAGGQRGLSERTAQAVGSGLREVSTAAAQTSGLRDQKGTECCMGRESNPGLPRGRREFYH